MRLADWYFTAALGIHPQTAVSYLRALDVLLGAPDSKDSPDEPRLVRHALRQLTTTEPQLRDHAIPVVMERWHRDSDDADVEDAARAVLGSALADVVPEYRGLLGDLVESSLAGNPSALADSATRAAGSLRNRDHASSSSEPYLDLHEFLPELVLLSCLRAVDTEVLTSALGEDRDTVVVSALLSEASEGRYGRLCQILAAELTLVLDPRGSSRLQGRILRSAGGSALLEPDLVATLVRIHFSTLGRVETLLDEAVSLSKLLRLRHSLTPWPSDDADDHRRAAARIGMENAAPGLASTLLWQASVWELAAKIDPSATARRLSTYWQAPWRVKGVVAQRVPHRDRHLRDAWAAEMTGLHRLGFSRPDAQVEISATYVAGPLRRERKLAAACLSPWLYRVKGTWADSTGINAGWETPRFLQTLNPSALLRLFTASTTALHLMEHADARQRESLVGLVLHAEDVTNDVPHRSLMQKLEKYSDTVEDRPPLPKAVCTLALMARRTGKAAGRGEHPKVDPAWFVDYAFTSEPQAVWGVKRLRQEPVLWIVNEFVKDALSGHHAIPGPDGRRSGPWFDDNGRDLARYFLEEAMSVSGKNVTVRKLRSSVAAHLKVYYGQEVRQEDANWHEFEGNPSAHHILASRALSVSEWIRHEPPESAKRLSPLLAQQTERLIELFRNPDEVDPALAEKWSGAWVDLISSVTDPVDLSRIQRMRALDLLSIPIQGLDWQRRVLENLIDAQVEFGTGTPVDLWSLFRRFGPESCLDPDLNEALRIRLLQRIHTWRTRQFKQRTFTDPWEAVREEHRKLLLEDLQRDFHASGGTVTALRKMTELWSFQQRSPHLLERTLDLEEEREPSLSLHDRRSLLGMTSAPGGGVRLHLLPSLDSEGRRQGSAPTTGGERHGIVSAVDAPSGTDDRRSGWANAHDRTPVRIVVPQDGGVGDRVVIGDLVPDPAGEALYRTRPAHLVPMPGEVRTATVWTEPGEGGEGTASPRVRVEGQSTVHNPGGRKSDEELRRLWSPDIAGCFSEPSPDPYECLVSWSEEKGAWLPVDVDFTEFVMRSSAQGTGAVQRMVVVDSLSEEEALRFSLKPGVNVVIPDRAWSKQAMAEWARVRDEYQDLRGLVANIHVGPSETGGRTVCSLRSFDDRNLRWRELFSEPPTAAVRRSKGWRVEHDIEGFPPVDVSVSNAPRGSTRCHIEDAQWTDFHQRQAYAVGRAVDSQRLDLGSPHDPTTFHSVLNIRKGDTFHLDEVWNRVVHGSYTAFTREHRLYVQVEAESIHLGTLRQQEGLPRSFTHGREVRVVHVQEVTVSPGRDTPALALAQILSKVPSQDQERVRRTLEASEGIDGLVVEVLQRDNDPLAVVWLAVGESAVELSVPLRSVPGHDPRPGTLVWAEQKTFGWTLTAIHRRIRVRALWELRSRNAPPSEPVLFLGTRPSDKGDVTVAQAVGAPVIYEYPASGSVPGHLEKTGPATRARGVSAIPFTRVLVEGTRARTDNGLRRVTVHQGELRWPGHVGNADIVDAHTTVRAATIGVRRYPGNTCEIERRFRVARRRDAPVLSADGPPGTDDRSEYRNYVARGRPVLNARINTRTSKAWVDISWKAPVGRGELSRNVPLLPGERTRVSNRYRPEPARIVLVEDSDGYVRSSYRQAPPLTLDDFQLLLAQQGIDPGVRGRVRYPIFYAGRERDRSGEEYQHLFEWGYGLTLSVPGSRLTLDGRTVGKNSPALYLGDRISHVLLGEDRDGLPVLDISAAHVYWGTLHNLRHESGEKVVHIAVIEELADRSQIVGIETRALNPLQDNDKYDDTKLLRFRGRHATLSEDAQKALGADRSGRKGKRPERRRILVRMDGQAFDRTGGGVLSFDCVAPTFQENLPEGWKPLRKGDGVFLRAEKILARTDDTVLHLSAQDIACPPGVTPLRASVGRALFSYREDLLRRIHHGTTSGGGSDALKGSVYLVRLKPPRSPRGNRVGASIKDAPARSEKILRDYIEAQQGSPVYATVGTYVKDRSGKEWIRLEIEPNYIFAVRPQRSSGRFAYGTIVLVQALSGHGFRLSPALHGDSRYLGGNGRPVILLPKQSLLGPGRSLAKALAEGHYLVAGLPGRSIPALPPGNTPSEAEYAHARRLICTPHPKIARITDASGRWSRIEPGGEEKAATIDVDAGVLRPVDPTVPPFPVDWSQLTFLDRGVSGVRERILTGSWTYHDQSTAHRSPEDPDRVAEPVELPRRLTAVEEPVFFNDSWSLRYRPDEFIRHGYPATSLMNLRPGEEVTLPVAAVLGQGSGFCIWVESAPGRVVELTPTMLTAGEAPFETPLTGMDWEDFGPGDLLHLRDRRQDGELRVSALHLAGWAPGPRSAFGRARALLPARSVPGHEDTVRLGAGVWSLDYPASVDEIPSPFVWLGQDNRWEPAPPRPEPRVGDVVLLSTDDDGEPLILGVPDAIPVLADGDWPQWQLSALSESAGRSALLGLVGGALPAMVVSTDGDTVAVSCSVPRERSERSEGRRRGEKRSAHAPRGRGSGLARPFLTKVLGTLPDGKVVLRRGPRLLALAGERLLPSAPSSLLPEAVRVLAEEEVPLWLHKTGTDTHLGLPRKPRQADASGEEDTRELKVRPIRVLGEDGNMGVLCWEHKRERPHWLAVSEVGWTRLTAADVEAALIRPGREITVHGLAGGGVSIIGETANKRRFEELRRGDRVTVEVIEGATAQPVAGRFRYLARLQMSDAVFEFLSRVPTAPAGPCVAEIERKAIRSHELTAVAPEALATRLDLPTTVISLFRSKATGILQEDSDPYGQELKEACEHIRTGQGDVEAGTQGLRRVLSHWLADGDGVRGRARAAFGVDDPGMVVDAAQLLALAVCLDAMGSSSSGPEAADFSESAVLVCRELGLRAMRSQHVAHIIEGSRLWKSRGHSGLWRRLEKIELRETLFPKELNLLRNITDGIRIRTALPDTDDSLRQVNESLSASVGLHMSFDDIHGHSGLEGLVSFGRALVPPSSSEVSAQERLLPAQRAFVFAQYAQVIAKYPSLPLLSVPRGLRDPGPAGREALLERVVGRLLRTGPDLGDGTQR